MSNSSALTEDWTLSWMLTGFVTSADFKVVENIPNIRPSLLPYLDERSRLSAFWVKVTARTEGTGRKDILQGPHISIFLVIFGLKCLTSTHGTWSCPLPAYCVIPPDQVSLGRASRFSRCLWALVGIFKADSHLSISLVKCSQVFWPQHLAIQPGVGLVVSRTLRGEKMNRPPTGVMSLLRAGAFQEGLAGLAEQLKPTMEL